MQPNLLIVGAQKSGTTWLHRMLAKHPEIFMAEGKELNFFNRPDRVRDEQQWLAYQALFEGGADRKWRGESTPHYFWRTGGNAASPARAHDTAAIIDERLPDVTLLVSLRDPVSRAVSAYWHHFSQGRFDLPTSMFQLPWEYGVIDLGFYKRHWQHWHGIFGDRLNVLLYDDLVADPKAYLEQALKTLGEVGTDRFWKSVDLTQRPLNRTWVKVFKEKRHAIKPMEIVALLSLYEDDIAFVEELTGRDLSPWRDVDRLIAKHCPE